MSETTKIITQETKKSYKREDVTVTYEGGDRIAGFSLSPAGVSGDFDYTVEYPKDDYFSEYKDEWEGTNLYNHISLHTNLEIEQVPRYEIELAVKDDDDEPSESKPRVIKREYFPVAQMFLTVKLLGEDLK